MVRERGTRRMKPREETPKAVVCVQCYRLKLPGGEYKQIPRIECHMLLGNGSVGKEYCPPCYEFITETQGLEE